MSALHETNKNSTALEKAIKQATSGTRINSAGDDASGYSISEKMRAKIRALGQCKENSAKGQDLIDTASAAVDQQVNITKQVKTIALRATDDTYTDKDRENLQKELSQLLDQSDDIANTTFNGIQLLNQRTVSRTTQWFDADSPYRTNKNGTVVLAQTASGDYDVPQGEYVDITSSTVLYDPTKTAKGSALTSFPSAGDYVWDDRASAAVQVTVVNNTYYFGSSGRLLSISGLSNPPGATASRITNVSAIALQQLTPPLAAGTVVSETNTYPATTTYTVTTDPYTGQSAYFRTSGMKNYDYITELDLSSLQNTIANVPADLDGIGFSIDCNGCNQFITVMFDATASDTTLYEGRKGSPPPMCYVIGVSQLTAADFPQNLAEAIFNGINATTAGTKGADLPSATDTSTTIAGTHNVKLNYYAATGKLSITKDSPGMTIKNGLMGEMKTDLHFLPEQGLYVQSGDESSQNIRLTLPNTTLEILFPTEDELWDIDPEDEDYPDEWPKGYENLSEAAKREKWKQEVWRYPANKSYVDLSNCVATRDKANVFLDKVDQAIKYLLDSNTGLGAQSNRLDYTQDNIVVMQENTTSAESVLRDADMAKVMVENAKSNLLLQAASSMLAQANQTPQNVLSLLS